MIYSRARQLRFQKEEQEGRKLTYDVIQKETGLSPNTLVRLLGRDPLERIDGQTLTVLCRFFNCTPGDVLEYVPEPQEAAA